MYPLAGSPNDSFEELTFAEEERERLATDCMLASLAEVVRTAMPGATTLIVARGHGLPRAILVNEIGLTRRDLDPVVLAQLLVDGHDDRTLNETARLVLGDVDHIEHLVAHDATGDIAGVVAVVLRDRAPAAWLRSVLSRIAATLAAWGSVDAPSAANALLAAIPSPVVVHDVGTVLAANGAVCDILDCDPLDMIGRRVARVLSRVPMLQTGALVIGGRIRAALILQDLEVRTEVSVAAIARRVVATHYASLRACSQVAIEAIDACFVAAPESSLETVVTLAVLDAAACFERAAKRNILIVRVLREMDAVVIEVIASGALAPGRLDHMHLGAAVCANQVARLGGRIEVDVHEIDRRMTKVLLPAAVLS